MDTIMYAFLSRGDLFFEMTVEDKFNDFKVSFDFDEKLV